MTSPSVPPVPRAAFAHALGPGQLLRAAHWYASVRHWHVFPLYEAEGSICSCRRGASCGSPGKHPRTVRGCLDATTDPLQIRHWWQKWPSAAVGIATGPSRLIVVDIDPRNDGDDSLSELVRVHGELPATPLSLTGGGGQHYVFAAPPDTALRGTPLARGVDIKATGGYIVAPPSPHVSGRPYAWDVNARPDEIQLAPCPAWVVERLSPATAQTPSTDGPVLSGFLGAAFNAAGWLGRAVKPNCFTALCPWEDEHTGGVRFDGSTVVFGPQAGRARGWWYCAHEHCRGRTQDDVLAALPEAAKQAAGSIVVDVVIASTAEPNTPDWKAALQYKFTARGNELKRAEGNAALILAHDPAWTATIGYDEFARRRLWLRDPPPVPGMQRPAGEGRDEDILYVSHWLLCHYGVEFSPSAVRSALDRVAMERSVNSLTDYLQHIEWDGTPRIDSWLSQYLGAEPSQVNSQIGRWWLISAVARGFRPGAQVDHVLVLEGPQGSGKSSAVRILGGPWYLGTLGDIGTKEASERLAGRWIVEIGELDALRGHASSRVKDFLTQTVDTYRPSYGRASVPFLRQCVFVGTTNDAEYLRDATGARRFWPVRIVGLDRDALTRDRDQLFAEAVRAYQDGADWWPASETAARELAAVQSTRYESDPWEEPVSSWLVGKVDTTVFELARDAIKMQVERHDRATQRRLGAILQRLGWVRGMVKRGPGWTRGWTRAEESAA